MAHAHEHGVDGNHERHFHGPLPYFRSRIGLPFNPDFKFLLLIALSLVLLYLFKRVVVIVLLLIAVMAWDFVVHYFHFPVHLDPMPFASFFVSAAYGLPVSVLFILAGGILPELLVGHFEISDFFSFVPIIIVNVIFFASAPASFFAPALLALFLFVAATALIALFSASPPHKYTLEPIAVFILNAALIYRLAPLLFAVV